MPAIGIALENIASAATGNIALYGEVFGIDTTAFSVGQSLYVSATTPGALTNVAPTTEANLIQTVGKVVRSNANGIVMVQGAGRTNATPNLNENNIFIGNATNQATTIGLASLTSDIGTTGNVTFEGGNVEIGNPSAVFGLRNLKYDYANNRLGIGTGDKVGVGADGSGMYGAVHILSDNSTTARVNFEENRNSSTGPDIRYYKSRGTYSSPAAVNSGDRIKQEFYTPYGTTYGNSRANWSVFADGRVAGFDTATNVIPLSYDFEVSGNGLGGDFIAPLQIQGMTGNVMFGMTNILANGTANATIEMSGNISTVGNVHTNVVTTNTGSELTLDANVLLDNLKPKTQFGDITTLGNVNISTAEANVPVTLTAAIDQIISSVNQGSGTDTIGISGQTGSGFDATQVVVSGIVDTGFTQVNGNTYYVKWDGVNLAYGLYTDVNLTVAVQVMTGGSYVGSPAGTPIVSYDGGSSIQTIPANLTVAGSTVTNNLILKKFNETVVALGNQSGDISSVLNVDNGTIYSVTATGDITINSLANAIAGTSFTLIITQDATGNRLLTSSMKFSNGGFKTLSTGNGNIDIISVFYDGSTYYATLTTGYA